MPAFSHAATWASCRRRLGHQLAPVLAQGTRYPAKCDAEGVMGK